MDFITQTQAKDQTASISAVKNFETMFKYALIGVEIWAEEETKKLRNGRR
jgi:hypothetical protein